jgi:hypothetical protein
MFLFGRYGKLPSFLRDTVPLPISNARNRVAIICLRFTQGENTFSFNLYEIAKIGSFA